MTRPKFRRKSVINNSVKSKVIRLYNEGKSVPEIIEAVGYSSSHVRYWLNGVNKDKEPYQPVDDQIKLKAIEMHEKSIEINDIMDACGLPYGLVRYYIIHKESIKEKILNSSTNPKKNQNSISISEFRTDDSFLNVNDKDNSLNIQFHQIKSNQKKLKAEPKLDVSFDINRKSIVESIDNLEKFTSDKGVQCTFSELYQDLERDRNNCHKVLQNIKNHFEAGRSLYENAMFMLNKFDETLSKYEVRSKLTSIKD